MDLATGTRPTRIVPCNGCTECCKGDAIYMHPECGDDARRYKTEVCQESGRTMLAHKPNGDCVYLDRKTGCTIWERRPVVCREMDCVIFLDPELMRRVGASKKRKRKLIAVARRRVARGE